MKDEHDLITYHPPFKERSDTQLLTIVGDEEQWQPYARALAEAELRMRGMDQTALDQYKREQVKRISERNEMDRQEMLLRPRESYSVREALVIITTWTVFVMIEHISFGLIDVTGKGLWTLSAEKRWLKFWQRCVLILASLTLYAFILTTFIIRP